MIDGNKPGVRKFRTLLCTSFSSFSFKGLQRFYSTLPWDICGFQFYSGALKSDVGGRAADGWEKGKSETYPLGDEIAPIKVVPSIFLGGVSK